MTGNQARNSQTDPTPQLKPIKCPIAPYPDEAVKKKVEGKVVLRITVDAKGRVSDAKVLSGPPELYEAALASVRQCVFEPPENAPVISDAEVSYGFQRECPPEQSEFGSVIAGNKLNNGKGAVAEIIEGPNWILPPYFPEDRKAGISGVMTLSVSINKKGKPTKVTVVHSLSPHLDNAAIKTVRKWRFKLAKGPPGSFPGDFLIGIDYEGECSPKFFE